MTNKSLRATQRNNIFKRKALAIAIGSAALGFRCLMPRLAPRYGAASRRGGADVTGAGSRGIARASRSFTAA